MAADILRFLTRVLKKCFFNLLDGSVFDIFTQEKKKTDGESRTCALLRWTLHLPVRKDNDVISTAWSEFNASSARIEFGGTNAV